MRAAIYRGAALPISIEQVEDPIPGEGELLIEVGYCGICGSDISLTSGTPFDYPHGQCFGHEYAGTVVELGRGVSGWEVGERVASMPLSPCGRCEPCSEGRMLFCTAGKGVSSGFSEYVAVPTPAAVRLPQSLSLADGALIEPMACGLHALRNAHMRGGERILVLGAGTMALAIVWWARQLGASSIVVASRTSTRKEMCLAFGADAFHLLDDENPAELYTALGGAPHIVAECVGREGLLNTAINLVRLGGTVISMGMCHRPERLVPFTTTFKEATLTFPLAYSPAEFEDTARAFDRVGFNPSLMVSDVIALEQLSTTFDAMRAGSATAKIHVDPRIIA